MKKTFIVLFISGLFLFFIYLPCFAQDPGEPDTVRFLDWGSYVICPPCTGRAVVPMYVVNDESLFNMTIPLKWTGPLDIDTAIFVGERSEYMTEKYIGLYHQSKTMLLFATILGGDEFIPPGEGILIYLYFTIQDTGFAYIDTTKTETSYYHFYDRYEIDFMPIFFLTEFHIEEQITLPGDVNQDGSASISDVIYLINYLFKGGSPPAYLPSGDVNLDCDITVADVVHMINYLFKSGSSLEMGCCYSN